MAQKCKAVHGSDVHRIQETGYFGVGERKLGRDTGGVSVIFVTFYFFC